MGIWNIPPPPNTIMLNAVPLKLLCSPRGERKGGGGEDTHLKTVESAAIVRQRLLVPPGRACASPLFYVSVLIGGSKETHRHQTKKQLFFLSWE